MIISEFSYAQALSQEQMVASALEEFGKISGGLYINQRCKFLDNEKSEKFKNNVDTIKPVLGSEIRNPNMLEAIQQGAKKAADAEKYKSCGEDAKHIVEATSAHAENWAFQMNKILNGNKANKSLKAAP